MTTNAPFPPSLAARRAALTTFQRALGSETHILDQQPRLLWQQLYNRLQWEPGPIPHLLAWAQDQRALRKSDPWLHQMTLSGESQALLRTLRGHSSSVRACAVSPAGTRIASASKDRTVRLWDAATGRELIVCAGHTDGVSSCVFTPDGARVISASWDKTLRVWDVETGAPLAILAGHTDAVHHCAISPDGARLVSASEDHTLKVWEVGTGKELGTLVGHTDQVIRCAFAPDGVRVASTSWDRTLRLWNANTLAEISTPMDTVGEPGSCLFTPDGSKVLCATASDTNGWLIVWDVRDQIEISAAVNEAARQETTLRSRIPYGEPVIACAMSPDGQQIAISSFPNRLRLWDTRVIVNPTDDGYGRMSMYAKLRLDDSPDDSQYGVNLIGHTDYPTSCAFFADGQHLVSASGDQTLRVWDLREAGTTRSALGQTGAIRYCAFLPDRRRLVSLAIERYLYNTSGDLRAWDAKTGSELARLDQFSAYMVVGTHACAISPDGQQMISGISEGASLIDATTGEKLADLASRKAGQRRVVLNACAYAPGGEQFVAGYDSGALAWWDTAKRTRLARVHAHKGDVAACAYAPDGRRLVTVGTDGFLKIWDAQVRTRLLKRRELSSPATSCTYAPDGRRIATASQDGALTLWDDRTCERLIRLRASPPGDDIYWVPQSMFSPDGRQIASCLNIHAQGDATDGTLRLWDAGTGVLLANVLERAAEGIEATAFSPDARWLAWSSGQRLTLWDTQTYSVGPTWYAGGSITAMAFGAGGRSLAVGDSLGRLAFLEVRNIPMGPPLATLQYLYRLTEEQWATEPTAVCDWCGARTPAESRVVDAIRGIVRDASLASYHSPAAELPAQAWREPALLAECRSCHQPLHYNPYLVDNRDRY